MEASSGELSVLTFKFLGQWQLIFNIGTTGVTALLDALAVCQFPSAHLTSASPVIFKTMKQYESLFHLWIRAAVFSWLWQPLISCWNCRLYFTWEHGLLRTQDKWFIHGEQVEVQRRIFFQFHSSLWRVGCGVSTVACVGSQRTTRGDQFFPSTIWVMGMGLSLSALDTAPFLTDTHLSPLLLRHSFMWIRLGTKLICCREWHYSVTVCAHSSVYVAQTLMEVKEQLWEVSSFLLPRISWVNPNHRAYTESLFTLLSCLTGSTGDLTFWSSSTAHMWDYRYVPSHSVYVLLWIKARTQQILYQLGHIRSPRALSFYA